MKLTVNKIAEIPDTYICRIYLNMTQGDDFEVLPEYDNVFTLQLTDDTAYILGMMGVFTRDVYKKIKQYLKSININVVKWETHKNNKVIDKITYI